MLKLTVSGETPNPVRLRFLTADERGWTQMKSIITALYLRSSAFICGLIPLNSSVFMLKLTVLGISPNPVRLRFVTADERRWTQMEFQNHPSLSAFSMPLGASPFICGLISLNS
jgi:hypothetical protein